MDLTEQTLSSDVVYDGALLCVHSDRVRLPDGTESVREWIDHPGASAVVPLFANGDTMLVRQYRYPSRRVFLEVPAGKLDAGETPEETAVRELAEEVGLAAGRLTPLGAMNPTIGYSDETIHLFLAEDITVGEAHIDEGEALEPVRMPFAEAVARARRGGFADGKTALALLLADAVVRGGEI